MTTGAPKGPWPELPLAPWRATRDTLHLVSQLLGKTLLAACDPQNHWWHTALRVTSRGLAGASPVRLGERALDLELDLVDHLLAVRSEGRSWSLPLEDGRSMHGYLDGYLGLLRDAGVQVRLWPTPVEVPAPVPFDRDERPRAYDPAAAHRFLQVLQRCDAALRGLAASFVGKQSPVHFFWGSFDLAATRFSGRRAPERPGADPVTREAYSHEVISFGFWPGGESQTGVTVEEPVVYAYAAPEPEGFSLAEVPAPGRWDGRLGEFALPYEEIRAGGDPAAAIRGFCEAVYAAGATLGEWDRAALERGAIPAAGPAEAAHAGVHPSVHQGAIMCEHLEGLGARREPATPSGHGCQECLASGDAWVHLRLCLACGHVGCCDDSPRRHATRHFHATGHPLIKSFEPGEDWAWCFEDEELAPAIRAFPAESPRRHYAPPAAGAPG